MEPISKFLFDFMTVSWFDKFFNYNLLYTKIIVFKYQIYFLKF